MLKEGDAAPEFKVLTDTGEEFDLADHKKEKIVLYFYPRADTPGCTIESCAFRDAVKKFTKKGVTVIGVSPDTTKAQAKFKEKFELNFTLLADAEKEIANKYGVMKEKIVLYFYPRADTPGCTIESCEFRDTVKKFTKKGVTVLGVSPDTTSAQAKFCLLYTSRCV